MVELVKYYLWTYSGMYDWRPTGKLEGYDTLQELEKENYFEMQKRPYKILKGVVIGGSLEAN